MTLVVPAVLPKSKQDLEEKLALYATIPTASRVQIDVVDGRFASPPTWPYVAPQEFAAMRASGEMLPFLTHFEYEIDLMCLDAEKAALAWISLGASRLTFHVETTTDIAQLLIRTHEACGPDAVTLGLAISIDTNLAMLEGCLQVVEYVQFMGIARIGKQGQPFDNRVIEKIRTFRKRHPSVSVQVDGGVSVESAQKLFAVGTNTLVVGSGILKAQNPVTAFAALEALQNPYDA